MKEKLKEIGARIKQVRTKANLNQVQYGERLGLKGATISKYENGESDAGAITLAEIAKLGDTTLDWLITGARDDRERSTDTPITTDNQLDFDTLQATIAGVEDHLQNRKGSMAPAKKAELIATLYEMFSEEESKQVDKKTVAKLIKLAS